MRIAALLIGVFMMCVGIVGLVIPEPATVRAFLAEFTATRTGLFVVAAARIAIGFVFIQAAARSRFPRGLRIVGIIAIVLGIATAFVSGDTAQAVLKWELAQSQAVYRAAAAFWLVFGAFITYAVSRRNVD